MQSRLPLEEEHARQPGPELVVAAVGPSSVPEQLPLLQVLEAVRDRVESLHAGQRVVTAELKEIKANLPLQRRPLSRKTQELHIRVIWSRRNGLCPCCQTTPVCVESGRLDGSEYDHWFGRHQARTTQTWLICRGCNQQLTNTEFKAEARSAFEAYQQALRPFLGGRQLPLPLPPKPTS